MRRLARIFAVTLAGFLSAATAASAPPGGPAPSFTGKTATGETVSLQDFRGQPVVLEWSNHQCPFVAKHYETGNMQRLQRRLTEAGAVWITIISSAPGKQGHVTAAEAREIAARNASYADHILLDPTGEIGRAYHARTTPQMALIRADGTLAYNGAIDDQPSTRRETVDKAENYLLAAFRAITSGTPVAPAVTKPYGCSVKY